MLIIKMGGMLDCSAGVEDEIDVANHSGPIKKPFHRMTIREIEYTVKYEKQQFNKSLEEKKLSRIRKDGYSGRKMGHVGAAK